MASDDFNPMAENPYDRLGISPDASSTEFRRASIKARAKYNPDKYSKEKKEWARQRLFRIQDAIEAIETGSADSGAGSPSGADGETETGGSSKSDDKETHESEIVHLDISAETSRVSVSEPIFITVFDADELPVENVEVTSPGIDPVMTNEKGRASLEFDTTGNYTVTADKSNEERSYVSDSITIEVEQQIVELDITADEKSITVDESVVVEASIKGGDDTVSSVRFETSRGDEYFAATGRKRLSFEEPGEIEITATKPETDSRKFVSDSMLFEIQSKPVDLSLEINPVAIDIGESTYVRVLDSDNNAVSNAKIVTDSDDEYTLPDGTGKITFEEPGYKKLTATVDDSEVSASTTSSIRVYDDDSSEETDEGTVSEEEPYDGMFSRYPDSDTNEISIDRSTDKITVDESIEFSVSDTDGTVVNDVQFEILETGKTAESADGTWVYSHDEGGRYTVQATVETEKRNIKKEAVFSIEEPISTPSSDSTHVDNGEIIAKLIDDVQGGSIRSLLFISVIGLMAIITMPIVFDVTYAAVIVIGISIVISIGGVVSLAFS